MKFQPDLATGVNVVGRFDSGPPPRVWVGAEAWSRSIILPWQGAVRPWPPQAHETLTDEHFGALADLGATVVVFGSGATLRFVRPALLRPLIERGIGIETMDTAAACRTYNVLAAEGRAVVAALLLEVGR